jgi:hypothetical protein
MMFHALRVAGIAALFFCSSAVAQVPATAAAPVDLAKVQQIVGSWNYAAVPGGTQAAFIDSTANARLILRCTRATRLITLTRPSTPVAATAMLVTTSFGGRSLPASYDAAHNLTASVTAADSLLDDMALSRGRFAVSSAGSSALVVPAWGEVARVIEDCRN